MAQFIDESKLEIEEPTDKIEEPQEAVEATPEEPQEEEVPERYKGKSPKELIRMHQEAEKLMPDTVRKLVSSAE